MSSRSQPPHTSEELRYYITSREADAEALGRDIRDHWSVENKLHHILDVAYREDECRVRKDNGAENLSVLRRVVQNMVKLEKSRKLSTNKKRTLAAVNPDYRINLLGAAYGM